MGLFDLHFTGARKPSKVRVRHKLRLWNCATNHKAQACAEIKCQSFIKTWRFIETISHSETTSRVRPIDVGLGSKY